MESPYQTATLHQRIYLTSVGQERKCLSFIDSNTCLKCQYFHTHYQVISLSQNPTRSLILKINSFSCMTLKHEIDELSFSCWKLKASWWSVLWHCLFIVQAMSPSEPKIMLKWITLVLCHKMLLNLKSLDWNPSPSQPYPTIYGLLECGKITSWWMGRWRGFPRSVFESDFHEPDFWLDFYAGRTWPNDRVLEAQSAVAELRFGQISLKRNSPNLTLWSQQYDATNYSI